MSELIYLASPYSHPDPAVVESRFEKVCRVASEMMKAGLFVYSPIAHTHPIAMHGGLPTGWDFWERYDREIISRCDKVLVLTLPGWQQSKGIAGELAIAAELGKPVKFTSAPEVAT